MKDRDILSNLAELLILLFVNFLLCHHLLSFHCCLKVIWTLNSILTSSIFSKLRTNKLTRTVVGPSGSEMLLARPPSDLTPFGLKNRFKFNLFS